MYQDIIRTELNEAAETLNKFISDPANIELFKCSSTAGRFL